MLGAESRYRRRVENRPEQNQLVQGFALPPRAGNGDRDQTDGKNNAP
jgi:hypothetical protein